MYICPQCGCENNTGSVCIQCGADVSVNYEKYMTLFCLPEDLRRSYCGPQKPEALVAEGLKYFYGENMEPDYQKAISYFSRAANQNDGRALYFYGLCCQWGLGTEKSDVNACNFYKEAYLHGFDQAVVAIGDCYAHGLGVAENGRMAAVWYKKGADAGNALAAQRYGKCLENGFGVVNDPEQARAWYAKSAMLGNADAIGMFGDFNPAKPEAEIEQASSKESQDVQVSETIKPSIIDAEYPIFYDVVFERLLRLTLGCPQGQISLGKLEAIEYLCIDGNKVSIEENVTCDQEKFWVAERIHNLSDLRWLPNLRHLEIHASALMSIDGLTNLKNLTYLSLGSCQISDIEALKTMVRLKELYLDNNVITDITPLKNLVLLERLDLTNNKITDIQPLVNMKALAYLGLNGNKIQDQGLKTLCKLTNLRGLFIANNDICDVSRLDVLKKLRYLDLSDNQIEYVSMLSVLPVLSDLGLKGNDHIGRLEIYLLKMKRKHLNIYETDSFDRFDLKKLI